MRKLYLLFSHRLTEVQEKQAIEELKAKRVKYLPEHLQKLWSNVPPDIPTLKEYLKPIIEWLESEVEPEDYILVQGDFGATYIMVNWAFSQGYIPIYSTTVRKSEEKVGTDGEIELNRKFSHRRYRLYEKDQFYI
ncbi:MAG: Uncharacterized protein HPY66_2971 [Firmicutes bacterium]|nr:Uncharacterized protein [Bacillota bacterium]